MFRGIYIKKIDVKGRVPVPSVFRDILLGQPVQGQVITIDTNHRCLLLYPLAEWEEIERQIESLSSFDPMSQRVKRLLIGHANDLEMDKVSRILIPKLFREYAKIQTCVAFIGQGKKMELWSQDEWEQQRSLWLEETEELELPDNLKNLAL